MKGDARVVEVVAHDPAWSEQFTAARRLLVGALPTAVSIEHIGSTSIPGLAAKPIIDIQVVVPARWAAGRASPALSPGAVRPHKEGRVPAPQPPQVLL